MMNGLAITVKDQDTAMYLIGMLLMKGFIGKSTADTLLKKFQTAIYPVDIPIDELKLVNMIENPLVKPFKKKIGSALEKAWIGA